MTFLRLAFGSDGEHRSWDAGLGETARLDRIVASDLIAVGWHGVLSAERARAMRQVIRDAVCPIIVVRVPVAPAAGPGAESPGGPRCGDVIAQTMKGAAVVVFDLDGVILRVADLAQVQLAGRRPDARVAV